MNAPRYIDPTRQENRVAKAQQRMNTAPTAELTAYFFRIWKARRRALQRLRRHLAKHPDSMPF